MWSAPDGTPIPGYGQPPDYTVRGRGGLVILLRAEEGRFIDRLQNIAAQTWGFLSTAWKDANGSWIQGTMPFVTDQRPECFSPEYYPTVAIGLTMKWAGFAGGRMTIGLFNRNPVPPEGWEHLPPTVYCDGGGADVQIARVIAHELGHGFGLQHSNDPASIMFSGGSINCGFLPPEAAVMRQRVAEMRARARQFVFP